MSLTDELRSILKGEVDDSEETREKYSRDASLYRMEPKVVVRPKGVADIQALVKYASEHSGVSLTPRSAGTDMSGGVLSSSVVVDMMKNFNHVVEVGADYGVVEPGVYFRDFDKETKKKGLELPSYTASREICAVGGMVGNNAGGEKHLKYGKTDKYVQELEVVMADGEVHTLNKDTVNDYSQKLSALLKQNQALIAEHKPESAQKLFRLCNLGFRS